MPRLQIQGQLQTMQEQTEHAKGLQVSPTLCMPASSLMHGLARNVLALGSALCRHLCATLKSAALISRLHPLRTITGPRPWRTRA